MLVCPYSLQVNIPTLMACYNEWHRLLIGSGKVGFNTNVANLTTGVFIATGQDVATVDSSHSIFSLSTYTTLEKPLNGKQFFPS